MSYYENQQAWPNAPRPATWEAPARTGTSNSSGQREEATAFLSQLEEVDRAVDNLVKSGKMFPPSRRDSGPNAMTAPYSMLPSASGHPSNYASGAGQSNVSPVDPRVMGQIPQRHHSLNEYGSGSSSNLQSFYANQRFQPRQSETEQMMQAKRRMAAQRERELRNYHQEQQYNRSVLAEVSGFGKDRGMSPGAHTPKDPRDLMVQQRQGLFGQDGMPLPENAFDGNTPRPLPPLASTGPSSVTSATGGTRGPSPLAFNPFGLSQPQAQSSTGEASVPGSAVEQPQQTHSGANGPSSNPTQRSRSNSASSPSSKSATFSLFDQSGAQNAQSSRTSASSPGGSPPRQGNRTSTTPVGAGVAPIGTRPSQNSQGQAPNPGLTKRATTPLPSPLSYGFSNDDTFKTLPNERTESAASTSSAGPQDVGVGLGWGSKSSGVWGSKGPLGVQASVWG